MLVSYNTYPIHSEHWKFSNGWETKEVGNARDVARIITQFSNSPILWKDGKRSTDNFISASWAVLDVDNGATIQDAIKTYGKYEYVIGTTKSHQKAKGKEGKKDRYRVWVRLSTECRSSQDFRETQRQLGERIGADEQAYDGARKYLPCLQIMAGSVTGEKADIARFIPPVVEKVTQEVNRTGFIPAFVRDWLTAGAPEGTRNKCIFKTGLYLGKNGFNLQDINNIVLTSSLASGVSNGEITNTLRRGYNASR